MLQLHRKQTGDSKKDLSAMLISLDLKEAKLVTKQTELEQLLLDCSLKVKELLELLKHYSVFS